MINKIAEKYVGVPYNPKGRSKIKGMDCIILLKAYYKEMGYDIPIPKYTFNGHFRPSNVKLFNAEIAKLVTTGKVIWDRSKLHKNDLLLFSISGKDRLELAAAYLGEGKFLYMPHEGKSSISTFTIYWVKKFQYGMRLAKCL